VRKLRIAVFIIVAEIHALTILSVDFDVPPILREEERPRVMKLVDLAEYYVPPSPEPPPPKPAPVVSETPPEELGPALSEVPLPEPPPPPVDTEETIAERLIEVEEEPALPPGELEEAAVAALETPAAGAVSNWEEEYLPANEISEEPEFPVDQLREALVYPRHAKRAGIEGRVLLELFVDRQGLIRRVDVIAEEPRYQGFAEAARAAFENDEIICTPAKANGQDVSVRIRYPVSFRLTNEN
jgi:protein TonB